jgi:hypothetical protein
MIELTFVLIIIFFFVLPLPALAVSLGLFTTWFLYKKYESRINQPSEGKKLLTFGIVFFLTNLICSIFLGFSLAFGVYHFIYDNLYLLGFNFLFCFAVSLRWFDFTYHLYRLYIFKLKSFKIDTFGPSYFVVCQSLKEKGILGLVPIYTDAGILELEENKITFKGVFREEIFSSANILHIEKLSSEKIKIFTIKIEQKKENIFMISLKNQFYPFKSRPDRDKIFQRLTD